MNKYIGNPLQIYGVEKSCIKGGKGDGMTLLQIRNGSGLDFFVSVDRCADISRLTFKGDNMGYFSACGYVSPKYYDNEDVGFLKSFTAGFFTTCGLTAVGTPCTDDGEKLPLHGNISNTPCENYGYWIDDNEIHVKATIRDASLFSRQLLLTREYVCPLFKNVIYINDEICNIGSRKTPIEILYHCNMGYPLLSEKSVLNIPSISVTPRNKHAKEGIDNWNIAENPQTGYEEMCYYHKMDGKPTVSIYNPDINKKVSISYDCSQLKCFTQWKMMGEYEYVMGLEPGNCYPDGRDIMREKGILEFLEPDEKKICSIKFEFSEEK